MLSAATQLVLYDSSGRFGWLALLGLLLVHLGGGLLPAVAIATCLVINLWASSGKLETGLAIG